MVPRLSNILSLFFFPVVGPSESLLCLMNFSLFFLSLNITRFTTMSTFFRVPVVPGFHEYAMHSFVFFVFLFPSTDIKILVSVLKEDMEKLRQALKTLSEAEKQLRMSNDRLTWLTAALLQLAPDQQYMLPSSSADTSFNHSPLVQSNAARRERSRKSTVEKAERPNTERRSSMNDTRIANLQAGSSSDAYRNDVTKGNTTDRRRHAASGLGPQQPLARSADMNITSGWPLTARAHKEIDVIWLEVLQKIQISSIKEFVYREGKLIAVNFGAGTS